MNSAGQKWLNLAVDILSYEAAHIDDGELLSEACDRWIERRPVLSRACIVTAGVLLTAHLSNLIPDRYDALSQEFWRRNYRAWKRMTSS